MFFVANNYSSFKKVALVFSIIFLCQLNSQAQSMPDEKTALPLAVKQSRSTVMEIASIYAAEQAKTLELKRKDEQAQQGILSVINKTVEELEKKAEKQYQNNRMASIKEDELE